MPMTIIESKKSTFTKKITLLPTKKITIDNGGSPDNDFELTAPVGETYTVEITIRAIKQ